MESLDLCCGVQAIDDIVREAFRVDISKALDPTDPDDFLRIVVRLSGSLARATRETEAKILRRAINTLDVDWPNLTAAQRGEIIRAARASLRPIPAQIMPAVDQRLEVAAASTIRGTRRAARAVIGVNIPSAITLRDQRIIRHLTGSQALFITDEYGRRRVGYSRTARRIVSEGLRDGLGRDEIAADLERALGVKAGLRQSRRYWDVISAAFTNRARIYGHLSGFAEAGIERYLIEAVLDEATTEQCRFLHGKTFTVSKGLALYQQAEELDDPEAIKDLMPWPRVGRNADGEKEIFIQRGGERTTLATITRSGVGTIDDVGSHKNAMSSNELDALGVGLPPYHGLCRTTVVADV